MMSAAERRSAKAPKQSRPDRKKMTRVCTQAHSNNGEGASVGDSGNGESSKMGARRDAVHAREPMCFQPVLARIRRRNSSPETQSGLIGNACPESVSQS